MPSYGPINQSFRAVFFDFDGVIVSNSEMIRAEVMSAGLREEGIYYDVARCYQQFLGLTGEQVVVLIAEEASIQLSTEFLLRMQVNYRDLIVESSIITPSLLPHLPTIPVSRLCSNNVTPAINAILTRHQLKGYFHDDAIFSASCVKELKPHPEVYTRAIDSCGFSSEQCCAVEDSAIGVTAAKAANLFTIAYANPDIPYQNENNEANLLAAGADAIIDSFDYLPQFLGQV